METPKTPLTEEQKTRRRAGRTLGRALWRQEFDAANPEATREERSLAWKTVSKERTKVGMRAMRQLEKAGFQVIETAPDETGADAAAATKETETA